MRAWVNRVCSWSFSRIIPAHLQGTIDASPREFKAAFGFLDTSSGVKAPAAPFPDLGALLQGKTNEVRAAMVLRWDPLAGHTCHAICPSPRVALCGQVSPFAETDITLLRAINAFLLASGTISDEQGESTRKSRK